MKNRTLLSAVLAGSLLAMTATAVYAGLAAPSDSIVKATQLPEAADGLREIGVGDADIRLMLEASRNKGLGAGEATETLENVKSVEKNGHMDNLGSFVKSKIDEGLRGKELAEAIRAEKEQRGKNGLGRPDDPPGQSGEHGRSEQAHERNREREQGQGNKGGDREDRGGKGKNGKGGKKGKER